MSNKTRKHIWPVSLVMSIAIIGALAAFLVLAANPGETQAHGGPSDHPGTNWPVCDDMTDAQRGIHDGVHAQIEVHGTMDPCPTATTPGNGNGMMGAADHASMPTEYMLQGVDNGARLDWEMPDDVATGAEVIGYRIHRDAWNSMDSHPINIYGDAIINKYDASMTHHTDLGLAYETVYKYRVQAIVQYDPEHWWNNLGCPMMNDVVMPRSGEPQVGADTAGTAPYCVMYDDLSDAAKVVVHRAYDRFEGMYPERNSYGRYALGEWSNMRAIETADSGGRLEALLDPPDMVNALTLNSACDNQITVAWRAPDSAGTAPATDDNGVYVGPDYIGGNRAGKEEVGQDATISRYQVQRMVNNGAWTMVTPTGLSYVDRTVAYGSTYKYRVRAQNSAGLYGPWQVTPAETLTRPPQPLRPTSLVATHGLSSDNTPVPAIILQWDAPVDNATPKLWRKPSDVVTRTDNISKDLQYQIQRKIGNEGWKPLITKPHQYAQGMTAAQAINNFRTQRHEDTDSEALGASSVSYRVAALVDGCNVSPWNLVDEVEGEPQPRSLGTITNLALSNSLVLTWTPAANAASQIAIVVNAADDTDFCLAPALAASASSYACTTITPTAGTAYVGLVIALDSAGKYTISNFPVRRVQ